MTSIKIGLSSKEFSAVEESLKDLCKYVDKNSSHDYNPLAEYFDQEPSFDSIVELPLLDQSFEKFRTSIDTAIILSLIKMSLKSVSRDNYNITMLSVQEIINRKDAGAQKKIIQQFIRACDNYDFGHRYRGQTVLDTLYDSLFRAFECEALVSLITTKNIQMFDPQDGDGADQLLVTAFEKCVNKSHFKKLSHFFLSYKKEMMISLGSDYFVDFQNQIFSVLDEQQRKEFNKEVEQKARELRIFDLLDSNEKEDIIELIGEVGKKERKKFIYEDGGIVADKILSTPQLSKEDLIAALEGFLKQKELGCSIKISLDLLKKYGQEEVFNYFRSKHTKNTEEDLLFVMTGIIQQLKKDGTALLDLKPVYEFAQSFTNEKTISDLFSEELASKFKEITDHTSYDQSFFNSIEQLKTIISWIGKTPVEVYRLQLNAGLMSLAQRDEEKAWEAIKTVCLSLFKIMPGEQIFRGLHIAIIASIKTKDLDAVKVFENYVPKDTDQTRLTFNLACAYAKFSKKEELLYYVGRSVELGKPGKEFMDDPDFESYWNDADFLKAINK